MAKSPKRSDPPVPDPPPVDVAVADPPAVYPHELPRHLHQAGGVWCLVTTPEECDAALASGWELRPPPVKEPDGRA